MDHSTKATKVKIKKKTFAFENRTLVITWKKKGLDQEKETLLCFLAHA